jgi:hypothetical protein
MLFKQTACEHSVENFKCDYHNQAKLTALFFQSPHECSIRYNDNLAAENMYS